LLQGLLLEMLDAAGGEAADIYNHFDAVTPEQLGKLRPCPGAGS
jgi:uncharacterized protein (DUF433 family)